MKVRDWQDIVQDVVESDADPSGWRAVGGDRAGGVGEDLYVGHPNAGVFLLKTYAKNPFEVQGVGTRVARRIDEDLDDFLPTDDRGRFAVQQGSDDEGEAERRARDLEEVLEAHAEAPTSPSDLFDDVMETLESPAYGPMAYDEYDRPDELDGLATTFEEAEEIVDAEFEDVVESAQIDRGFQ
ncbi:MAG: hypothetical protein ABEJ77_03805 [Halanaeroarchaeum sp.]